LTQTEIPFGTAVQVQWHDSASKRGWLFDGFDNLAKIQSLGYVVSCTPDTITLSTSIATCQGVLDPVSIPWGAIETIATLGERWDR